MLQLGKSRVETEVISTFRECKMTVHFDIDEDEQLVEDFDIVIFYNENAEDDDREITEIKVGDQSVEKSDAEHFDFNLEVFKAVRAELDKVCPCRGTGHLSEKILEGMALEILRAEINPLV